MKRISTTLSSWVAPVSTREFLERYWSRQVLHSAADERRLSWLKNTLGGSFAPEALLEYATDVQAWYSPNGRSNRSFDVPAALGRDLHRAGHTLYFTLDAHPEAKAMLLALCRQLGQAPDASRISIFASRQGEKTYRHVDGNENFTVQLSGRKRWRVSAGRPPQPIERWDPGASVTDEPIELEMGPGAVLYLPGSWMHEIECLEDAVSLNLSLRQRSWYEPALDVLRASLASREEWTEPAIGLWGEGARQKAAVERLRELLGTLARVDLDFSLFEGRPTSDGRRIGARTALQRNPHARGVVVSDAGKHYLEVWAGTERTVLVLDREAIAQCQWVARERGPFLAGSLPGGMSQGRRTLQSLERAGFIVRR